MGSLAHAFGSRRVLIVCGGRDYVAKPGDAWWLSGIVQALKIDTIRHGGARGADEWAGQQAQLMGLHEDIRNRAMLNTEHRHVAVAALPGSKGTADMVTAARADGVYTIISPRVGTFNTAKDRELR